MAAPSDSMRELQRDRVLLERSSTAERVAEILRERIIEGLFRPGQKLSEKEIGDALAVSRNTLREAFRLLSHERLLVHELNRGVFVRSLTADDVRDIYQVRRVIELSAVRQAREASGTAVLLRPLPAGDVLTVAAQGELVPRKSTSFGPKPRTGLVLRTFFTD